MVGDPRGPGGSAAGLTADLRAAYDAAAGAWSGGPESMYAQLADALLAAAGVPLTGRLVLDLGAGTGAAGRAAMAAGARSVVSADLAVGMLRRCGGDANPVAAEATALPFRDRSFDLVVAAFCLNHLGSVAAGLREARRVGGGVAASWFAPGWTHPAKAAVDAALRPFGYQPPAWYAAIQRDSELQVGDPARLAEAAGRAGFTGIRLRTVTVATGLRTPAQLASWRLGLAHVAPFLRSLDGARRAAAVRAAESAVAGCGPVVVSMLVLVAS
jgi:SAM-dependent methyltransferase